MKERNLIRVIIIIIIFFIEINICIIDKNFNLSNSNNINIGVNKVNSNLSSNFLNNPAYSIKNQNLSPHVQDDESICQDLICGNINKISNSRCLSNIIIKFNIK